MPLLLPKMAIGGNAKYLSALYGPTYQAILEILGTTGTIHPLCDPQFGLPTAQTFTTIGDQQVTWTYRENQTASTFPTFDGHDALADSDTFPYRYEGIVPILDFNGVDENVSTPSVAYYNRAEVASPFAPFSIGAWVKPDVLGAGFIFSKYGAATARDYNWGLAATNKHRLALRDDSAAVTVQNDSSAVMVVSEWAFLAVTYTGDGGADAADSINLYTNGALGNGTPVNNASYVAMEALAALPRIGGNDASPTGELYDGQIAAGPLGPFFTQVVLTADQIDRIWRLGRAALGIV